jgi:transcription-repair coupling factor (superfamily II helicase)
MTTLEAGGIKGEYLMLTYANDAKLYVPVSSLHLISRYAGGAEDNAPLHKLGGDAWARARQKAAEKVRDVAAELLDIYAQRAAKEGLPLSTIKNSISCSATASRLKPRRIRHRLLMPY